MFVSKLHFKWSISLLLFKCWDDVGSATMLLLLTLKAALLLWLLVFCTPKAYRLRIRVFLCSRGWRIQWSIVPEVSEPMVLSSSCFCVRSKPGNPVTSLLVSLRSLQRKTWPSLRSSSSFWTLHRKHRYEAASKTPFTRSEAPWAHVLLIYVPSRTSLARWQTCWRKSRSKDRILSCCTCWGLFSRLLVFVCFRQPVYVGATWEHQETLHLPVGGFHQLLRAAIQTHGLHDRWGTHTHMQTELRFPAFLKCWGQFLTVFQIPRTFNCCMNDYVRAQQRFERWR